MTLSRCPSDGHWQSIYTLTWFLTCQFKRFCPSCYQIFYKQFEITLSRKYVQMKAVKHENVNDFIGVCFDSDNFLLLMLYSAKGTLEVGSSFCIC